jgi:6-phosphogluconolactonase
MKLSLPAAAGAFAAGLLSLTAHAATFVYVSNAGDGNISVYKLNAGNGALQALGTAPAGMAVMPMAISPDRRYLYASIRSKPYSVISYLIDSKIGALTQLGKSALPDSMAYVSTDRNGRYLFSASYGGDVIAVNPIGPQGVVQGESLQIIKTGPHAHSILPDLSNRFVYVANLGADKVLQFSFDEKTGRLEPIGPGYVRTQQGSGPRHPALSPNGRFLYEISELMGIVTTYRIDPSSGALTQVSSISGLDPKLKLPNGLTGPTPAGDTTPRIWAADMHITPDGRFVYVSERTSSTISAFSADPLTGKLDYLSTTKVEKQPRGFNIDPRGNYMVVSGEKSNKVGVYAIDRKTGGLNLLGQYPGGKGANWVEIVEYN